MFSTKASRVFVVLMAAVTSYSTAAFGSPVRYSPLRIADARYVSLDSIRVTWEAPIDDGERSGGVVVALGRDGCHNASRVVDLHPSMQQMYIFRDVESQRPYVACVRVLTGNTSEPYTWLRKDVQTSEGQRPPQIRESPQTYTLFQSGDTISLSCVVTGLPPPRVTWYKDGRILLTDTRRRTKPDGSLVVQTGGEGDAGDYQCAAENSAGRALSVRAILQQTVLRSFPPDEQVQTHSVTIGESVLLRCRVPHSVPPPIVTWMRIESMTDPVPRQVALSERIIQAEDDSLIFVSTLIEDASMYRCEVWNSYLDRTVSGSPWSLVFSPSVTDFRFPLVLLHRSPETVISTVSESVTVECDFGGRPQPSITWYRKDATTGGRGTVPLATGHRLTLNAAKASDSGVYRCVATQRGGSHNRTLTFNVFVRDKLQWTEKPKSKNATIGDNVTFSCLATGNPVPRVTWFLNGVRITESNASKWRYLVSTDGGHLTFFNVTKSYVMNVQCNVSNLGNYIIADAYMNVYRTTKILTTPEVLALHPGDVMKMRCDAETDPNTPLHVTWTHQGKVVPFSSLTRDHVYVDADRTLVVNLTHTLERHAWLLGSYTCVADNGISNDEISFQIMKTVMTKLPTSDNVIKSTETVRTETGSSLGGFFLQNIFWMMVMLGFICLVPTCVVIACGACAYRHRRIRAKPGRRLRTDSSIMTPLTSSSDAPTNFRQSILSSTDSYCNGARSRLDSATERSYMLNLHQLYIDRNCLTLGELIGKGQFGSVYVASMFHPGQKGTSTVAVKTLRYKAAETEMVELFLREAVTMKDFRHTHVLALTGVSYEEDGSPMVVLPYMANGDLRSYIQQPTREVTVLELLKMGLQVCRGLVYLSAMRFIHRDLAARNCMVDEHGTVKVADFGLSRDLFSRDYYRIGEGNPPLPIRWMAPECLETKVFTSMSDVWSFGVLIWELITRGAVPYEDIDNWEVPAYIRSGKSLPQPLYCPDSVYQIVQRCWKRGPHERPLFTRLAEDLERVINMAAERPKGSPTLYVNLTTTVLTDYHQTAS